MKFVFNKEKNVLISTTSGKLLKVALSLESKLKAISGSAEFFAPEI